MEKVQKVCASVQEVGTPDKHGNKSYSVTFTDNTSGFFRTPNQDLFVPGQMATFYYGKTTGKSGKEYYKIERVERHENQFPNVDKKTEKISEEDKIRFNRLDALKASCHVRAQSSWKTEDILKESEAFFDFLQFGVSDNMKTVAPTPPQMDPTKEYNLPF